MTDPMQPHWDRMAKLYGYMFAGCFMFMLSGAYAFMRPPDPTECIPISSIPAVCLDGALWKPCTEKGDVNRDGEINMVDMLFLQREILQIKCPNAGWNGDINSDGDINAGDLMLLYRIILEIQ